VHYRLILPEESSAPIQAGFAVPSRAFSRATDRNRIKRLTREAWRLTKNGLVARVAASSVHLHLFFVYVGREIPAYGEVSESFSVILKKLERLIPGPPPSPGAKARPDETAD
jgi:ribonuclease P protein component